MASTLRLSNLMVNTGMDAQAALLNGGFLDLYDGTQPATADTPVTTQTRLATLTFGTPAFNPAVTGVVVATALGSEPSIAATAQAKWARGYKADHTTVVCDWGVSTSGADINLNSTNLQMGGQLSLSSLTLTEPK